jgi:hypothetical protein
MVSPLTEGKGKGQSARAHRLTVNFYAFDTAFRFCFQKRQKADGFSVSLSANAEIT